MRSATDPDTTKASDQEHRAPFSNTSLALLSPHALGSYAQGIIPITPRIDHRRSAVFLVPGFLNECHTKPYGPEKIDLEAMRGELEWVRHFTAPLAQSDVNLFLVNWPSSSTRKLLSSLVFGHILSLLATLADPLFGTPILFFQTTQRIISTWTRAVVDAESTASSVATFASGFSQPSIIIGHSLGGRIALRVCEELGGGMSRPLKAVALAPAISAEEVGWGRLAGYTQDDIEVFFSRADATLKILYRLGQWSRDRAILIP